MCVLVVVGKVKGVERERRVLYTSRYPIAGGIGGREDEEEKPEREKERREEEKHEGEWLEEQQCSKRWLGKVVGVLFFVVGRTSGCFPGGERERRKGTRQLVIG